MNQILDVLDSLECRSFFLENSMKVNVARISGLKSASIQIWVRTGSACERQLLASGISHLAEHMMFKGFDGKSAFEIAEELRDMGAEMNAYTSYLKTVFYIDLPSENLEKALEYLSDFISKPNFTQEDFDSEKEVVLREIDMCKDEPDDLLFDAFSRLAFSGTEFEPSIIGRRALFEKITLCDLKNYVEKKYVPSNMFLTIASGENCEKVATIAKKYFGKIKENFAQASDNFKGYLPTSRKSNFVEFKSPLARFLIGAILPQKYFENPVIWDFISYILSSVRNSILQKSLKYERGILDDVSSEIFYDSPVHWLLIDCSSQAKNIDDVELAIIAEIEKVKEFGFDKSLIQKFLRSVSASYADIVKNSSELASKLGELEMIGASLDYLKTYLKNAQNLDYDSAFSAFKSLNFENRAIAICASKKSRKTVQKKSSEDANFCEVVELENGSKIILKKIENCPKIHFRLASLMGMWACKKSQMGLHGLSALMLSKGAKNMSADDIADFAEANAIAFSSSGGNNSANISSECLSGDWRKAFNLLTDAATSANFDKKTFEREREILISQIEDDLDDPLEKSLYLAKKKFFASSYLSNASDGEIDALNACKNSDCAELARGLFPANKTVLSVVGNFKKEEILEEVYSFLSTLKPRKIEIPRAQKLGAFGKKFEELGGFNQSLALSMFECSSALDKRGDLLAEIALEVLGGGSGLIFELVREKLALAYTATCSSIAGINAGTLYFYALAKKQNLEKILDLFERISQKMQAGDFEQKRLKQAQLALKNRLLFSQNDVRPTAMRLALNLLFGRKNLDDDLSQIDSVKFDELVEFSKKYFAQKMDFILK